ncbi:exported hypothetical protein [Gammaproteobacteria bacterium]
MNRTQFYPAVPISALMLALSPLTGWATQTCSATVPASTPNSAFTDPIPGTVTDTTTGLMWKRCPEGQTFVPGTINTRLDCSGDVQSYTWQQALQRPKVHNDDGGFAGYTDWRLPNIKELASIVEDKCYDPAINMLKFPGTPSANFWSSSADVSHPSAAWSVSFVEGSSAFGDDQSHQYPIRLVRAGLAMDSFRVATLEVSKLGTGSGSVTSDPRGINCGSNCIGSYHYGDTVTLTATAEDGSHFSGWSEACTGTELTCTVDMMAAQKVVATFETLVTAIPSYTLIVTRAGTGSGRVNSNQSGIDCGTDCSEDYDVDTSVTLTATPTGDSTFEGWSDPSCAEMENCVLNITAARGITAYFSRTHNAQPDLVITQVTGPMSIVSGVKGEGAAIVANQGTAAAGPFNVRFYLSNNPIINPSDIDSGWGCDVPSLAVGETFDCHGTIGVPTSTAPGSYYFGAYADALKRVHESNERNNGLTAQSKVTVTSGEKVNPDLVVTQIRADSSSPLAPGMTVNVLASVKNKVFNSLTGPFHVRFYLSTDQTITPFDIDTKMGCNLPRLAGGSTSTCSGVLRIPSRMPVGTYYLGAYVDPFHRVAESKEGNNGLAMMNPIIIGRDGR